MSKTITISISDADYEALRAAATQAHGTPEEIAAAVIALRFAPGQAAQPGLQGQRPVDPTIAVMRARGHLVDPSTLPPDPRAAGLPPYGTPEWHQFVHELAEELGDALERSGKSILDLIER